MLVSDLNNVRYLSGFTGSNAALLVFADDRPALLATDGRYLTQAARQAPDLQTVIERACGPRLTARAVITSCRVLPGGRGGFPFHPDHRNLERHERGVQPDEPVPVIVL